MSDVQELRSRWAHDLARGHRGLQTFAASLGVELDAFSARALWRAAAADGCELVVDPFVVVLRRLGVPLSGAQVSALSGTTCAARHPEDDMVCLLPAGHGLVRDPGGDPTLFEHANPGRLVWWRSYEPHPVGLRTTA